MSITYRDINLNTLTSNRWQKAIYEGRQPTGESNSHVEVTANMIILTLWTGVGEYLYQTTVYWKTGLHSPQTYYSKSRDEAIKLIGQLASTAGPSDYLCPICSSSMSPRTGPYGTFIACNAWKTNGCPGKLNADGKPTQKTLELSKKKGKKTQEVSESTSDLGARLSSLDIE